MKIMLDEGSILPTRAHPWDAGLDLYAMEDVIVPNAEVFPFDEIQLGSAVIDTGVHVEVPEGCYGEIRSRSGLMCKHGITTDGTIDAHYTGSIKVCLFNHRAGPYKVNAGDKIAQLVIVPCLLPELELVDSLEETDRGDGGFGSTGR